MTRFKKRTVEIEAIRSADACEYASHDWSALPRWLRESYEEGRVLFGNNEVVIWPGPNELIARIEDWIVREQDGTIYPCKPDIFEATYETVE